MFELLKTFVDVVAVGSFSRAASLSYITQSAVSQRIRKLEDELGVQLIVRGHGPPQPTEAGLQFYRSCCSVLQSYQEAIDQLHDMEGIIAGTVRLAAVQSIGLHELPPYVTAFLLACPDAKIQLEYRRSREIHAEILDGSLDIGLVAYPARHARVITRPFRHDELIVIAHPAHELARSGSIPITGLDRVPFVAFETDLPSRRAIDRHLRQAGIEVSIVQEFDNVETIKRAVEIGSGVSIVPRPSAELEIARGSVVGLRVRGTRWERPLAIIHSTTRPLSATCSRFVELLTAGQPD